MEREGSLVQFINPQTLPKWLLITALALSCLAFFIGWFSVDTKVKTWQYDSSDTSKTDGDPEGAGDVSDDVPQVTVDTEMKFLQLGMNINPNGVEDLVHGAMGDEYPPTYDQHFGKTGTAMLGVFLLHVVTTATLGLLLVVYLWQLRGRRELGASVYRLFGLYGAVVLVTGLSLAFQVPASAEGDVRDLLTDYAAVFESAGVPAATDQLFKPEVKFWYTWICCPPESSFLMGRDHYLVVSTTTSRPAAGFWFDALAVLTASGAIVMAQRAGHLQPPTAPAPRAYAPAPSAQPPAKT